MSGAGVDRPGAGLHAWHMYPPRIAPIPSNEVIVIHSDSSEPEYENQSYSHQEAAVHSGVAMNYNSGYPSHARGNTSAASQHASPQSAVNTHTYNGNVLVMCKRIQTAALVSPLIHYLFTSKESKPPFRFFFVLAAGGVQSASVSDNYGVKELAKKEGKWEGKIKPLKEKEAAKEAANIFFLCLYLVQIYQIGRERRGTQQPSLSFFALCSALFIKQEPGKETPPATISETSTDRTTLYLALYTVAAASNVAPGAAFSASTSISIASTMVNSQQSLRVQSNTGTAIKTATPPQEQEQQPRYLTRSVAQNAARRKHEQLVAEYQRQQQEAAAAASQTNNNTSDASSNATAPFTFTHPQQQLPHISDAISASQSNPYYMMSAAASEHHQGEHRRQQQQPTTWTSTALYQAARAVAAAAAAPTKQSHIVAASTVNPALTVQSISEAAAAPPAKRRRNAAGATTTKTTATTQQRGTRGGRATQRKQQHPSLLCVA
ncbi:hypothetical protein BX070DRAFT_232134 [Coemansia spiralis]|nr:hypothetical protein BX070DRAFT_232134 [Coemansia spiralis]